MRNQRFAFLLVFVAVLALVSVSCDNNSSSPKVCTVTVDYGEGFDKITKEVKEGDKFTLPEAKTKDGFEFDCFTDADGTKHNAGEEVTVNADMTFTAKWTALYLVKVDNGNGTEVQESKVREGGSFTLPSEPEKAGHVFLGYKDGDGNEYKAGTSIKVEKALTFTAEWREKTSAVYTVRVDYGTESKTESVNDGDKFTLPPAVERTDYEFISYKSGDASYKPGDVVTVVSDMTFTAEWARLYTVTVNSNNGTDKTTQKVREGEFALPPAPENGDAVFKAWRLGDREYNAGDKITLTGDIEIKALWKSYTVTFKDGATVVDTKTVESGQPVDKTEKTVTKDGYSFRGWSYNSADYDFSAPVTKDIVLEAVWLENGKVTVTLRENGTERVSKIESGTDFSIPTPAVTKKGYTFRNWKSGETEYSSGATISNVTESIVLEAQYDVKVITVTFKYTDKEGEKTDERKNLTAGTIVDAPVFETAEGKEFAYWHLEGKYSSVELPKAFYEDTVLVAEIWNVYLTVTFNYNDDGDTPDHVIDYVSYGSTINSRKPSDPVRSGYTFIGWFKNLEDESSFDFDNTKVTEEFTLYAKWKEVKDEDSVTLTLRGDKDEEKGIEAFSSEYKFAKGSSVSLNFYDYSTDDAYQIEGWSDGTRNYYRGESLMLDSDMSLTAVWGKKKCYVSFNLQDGKYVDSSGSEHTGTYYGETDWGNTIADILTGTLSRENYTLDYWVENYSSNKTKYDETQKITDSLYLYAVWKTDKTCTVTFDYGYDSKSETKTVTYGKSVSEPARPVRKGYSFSGWYSSETELFNFSSEITSNTTITAHWTEVAAYTVIYMNADGVTLYTTEEVLPGGNAEGVVMPSLSGMEAVGWYRIVEGPLDYYGSPYDFSTPVLEDIILMPKYIPSEEKVLGLWEIMDYYAIDFRKEGGENVFYMTDFANQSTSLVKVGTWNYDSDNGYLTLNAEGINALFINAITAQYALRNLGKEGESLEGYSGYMLKRATPAETVKGSWSGEADNWKINVNFSDDTYEDHRILYGNATGDGGVVAKIDTSGNYEVQPYPYAGGKVDKLVSFIQEDEKSVIGSQKSTFQSWLVVVTGIDSIAVGGFLGMDVLPLIRK